MDGPAELSVHDQPEWKIEDAAFRVALHHTETAAEAAQFARMCEAVVLEEEGVFGALPKYDNGTYTFLLDVLPYASFDGMEHRDSTVITGIGDVLHGRGEGMIGAAAHEFFHSWNVKRMRPKTLEPFDYERANMSGELWFAEGFTNYYGPLALERSGIEELNQFTRNMGSAVNAVLTSPGQIDSQPSRNEQPCSVRRRGDFHRPAQLGNTFISYYTYGQALAFGLDLTIREHFPGKSLDDWMRTVWREHPDVERPYTLADLENSLAEATGDALFAREFFERHVTGKEPLDYATRCRARRAGAPQGSQKRGVVGQGTDQFLRGRSDRSIQRRCKGSPLYRAGLERGDRILSVNGNAVAGDTTRRRVVEQTQAG